MRRLTANPRNSDLNLTVLVHEVFSLITRSSQQLTSRDKFQLDKRDQGVPDGGLINFASILRTSCIRGEKFAVLRVFKLVLVGEMKGTHFLHYGNYPIQGSPDG